MEEPAQMSDESALQLQARTDIERQLLRQALRHAVSNATFGIQGDNRLRHLSAQTLAFQPGYRTRDDGQLGSTTGTVQLNLEPPLNEPVRWSLQNSAGQQIASVVRDTGAPVTIHASTGGRYVLVAQRVSDQQNVGAAQLSIPAFIRVNAQLEHNALSLSALRVPAASQSALWSAVIAVARPVAQHILRPINVRLIWDGDASPVPFQPTTPPAEHERALSALAPKNLGGDFGHQQAHQYPGTVMLVSPEALLQGAPTALNSLLHMLPDTVAATLLRQQLWQFLHLGSNDPGFPRAFPDEPGWSLDASLSIGGFALLRCGLGAVDHQGTRISDSHGDDAERALHGLAAQVSWDAPASAPYLRFVELAGRQLGVCIAHAVLRLLGVQPSQSDGHLRDSESPSTVVAGNITASHPSDACCDLLGLKRPEETPPRPFSELARDLDHQAARHASQTRPDAGRWVDIAALESAPWRTGSLDNPMRAMPGETSKYDVLAGLVDEAVLQQLQSVLGTLPSAYGDVTFMPGDRDVLTGDQQTSRHGGAIHPRSDMIELIQRDLAGVGIGIGLQDRGEYAYRQFGDSPSRYDGWPADRPGSHEGDARKQQLMNGNTGWAVREFQLACRYPNRVHERLSGTRHYAEQLHVVQAQRSPFGGEGADLADPSEDVNGELDILAAHQLRHWRFTRRRYPIVVVTGTGAGPHQVPNQNGGALRTFENLHRTNDANSDAYRVFVFDRSGYFGAPTDAVTLGDWGKTTNGWSGPHASKTHAQLTVTPGSVLGVEDARWMAPSARPDETAEQTAERERRERFLDVYRVIAAVAEAESRGRFDSLNAYDDATFSYPLFHHTLTLLPGRPGQMTAFVRWLQRPPAAQLEAAFPAAGAQQVDWTGAHPERVEQCRAELSQLMQRVYAQCFGQFGLGAGEIGGNPQCGFMTIAGLQSALTESGVEVDLRQDWNRQSSSNKQRQQALYQSYNQWFRTWHWCYRFVAALRQDQRLRTLLFAYEAHWIDHFLARHSDTFRTQRGRAVAVRIQIRSQKHFTLDEARRAASGASDEAQAILDAILAKRDGLDSASRPYDSLNGLHNSTRMTANFTQANLRPWQSGRQSNDIYLRVRNDVLRSMVGE